VLMVRCLERSGLLGGSGGLFFMAGCHEGRLGVLLPLKLLTIV